MVIYFILFSLIFTSIVILVLKTNKYVPTEQCKSITINENFDTTTQSTTTTTTTQSTTPSKTTQSTTPSKTTQSTIPSTTTLIPKNVDDDASDLAYDGVTLNDPTGTIPTQKFERININIDTEPTTSTPSKSIEELETITIKNKVIDNVNVIRWEEPGTALYIHKYVVTLFNTNNIGNGLIYLEYQFPFIDLIQQDGYLNCKLEYEPNGPLKKDQQYNVNLFYSKNDYSSANISNTETIYPIETKEQGILNDILRISDNNISKQNEYEYMPQPNCLSLLDKYNYNLLDQENKGNQHIIRNYE